MTFPFNYPTPTNCNVQTFSVPSSGTVYEGSWVKPIGVSFVWFTLIGAGGGGDSGTTGGGSGSVTNCLVPAFLVPDELTVWVGKGGINAANGTSTVVNFRNKTTYTLLTAGPGSTGGATNGASTSNYFSCMGFFQSVDGQTGSTGAQTASSTTFLSGGAGATSTTSNYGYSTTTNGFFQTQPIIVGVSGATATAYKGGIGCGGSSNGIGGDGLCVIISW